MPLTAPSTFTRSARSQSSVVRLWMRPFGREHARVADQHVEPAEALLRERDDRFDVGDLADVGQQRLDRASALGQAVDGGFERRRRSRRSARRRCRARPRSCSASAAPSVPPAPVITTTRLAAHASRYPPSTLSTVPVTNADASDARNEIRAREVGRRAPTSLRGVPEHARFELGTVLPSFGQRRVEPSRRDDVHGDARRREIERETLRHADEPGLRRAVRGEPFARPLARAPSR